MYFCVEHMFMARFKILFERKNSKYEKSRNTNTNTRIITSIKELGVITSFVYLLSFNVFIKIYRKCLFLQISLHCFKKLLGKVLCYD